MHPSIAQLVELMPPPEDRGVSVDWGSVAAEWRTPLPTDYREFIDLYGGGSINDSFHFCAPSAEGYAPPSATTLATGTELGFGLFGGDPDAEEEAAGRICWAFDAGANHAYWDTTATDPDQWTVMVLHRYAEWERFKLGMAEFMVAFLTGAIPQPMALFDPGEPVFQRSRLSK
ncbi:hypothetical protein KDL01_34545 [Actinospica durhamensis]|uniref:SMI1/KNR4 family protein n=1 Tax=Actinospica durhamensis TaxID=1508375 RepID=A0A941IU20_9ACTN|nr:hypothetical protein [Actinospica durhamensis]MBR7838437.1 hypothetical protein [Actinospica durhamensis]